MSAASGLAAIARRPPAVSAAVILAGVIAFGTIVFMLIPGDEETPWSAIAFAIVAAIVTLIGARALWSLRRWGAVVVFVATLLNLLSSLPGLFVDVETWVLVGILIGIPLCLAVLVLIALPSSRRAYH